MLEIRDHAAAIGKWDFPTSAFTRVTGSSKSWGEKVPIIHIHGCMTPSPERSVPLRHRDRRDMVVALETTYSAIAATASSWSQATFLHYSHRDYLVFVGHSLSDPSIRRWLSWTTADRKKEASRIAGKPVSMLPHVWLTRRPMDSRQAALTSGALVHLGVRVVWLDSWSQLADALANLLALKEKQPVDVPQVT
jgi:hypothetical protein